MTAKETVASQLADLAFGYCNKYKIYDDFTLLCVNKALEYFPQHPNALLIKGKSVEWAFKKYLVYNGYRRDERALYFENQLKEVSIQLERLCWAPMSTELHNKLEEGIEEVKKVIEGTKQQ